MKRFSRDARLRAAAWATVLPAALLPLRNPDLFWHLRAGEWMIAHRALPRVDSFSFTEVGKPWVDFEWLSELIFAAARRLAGPAGLWALKAALVAAVVLALARAMRRAGADATARALLVSLWSAGAILYADLRPDLFSLLGLALVLGEIAGPPRDLGARALAVAFAGFALWASLHAGFAFGLAAFALAAAVRAVGGRRAEARRLSALAAAGLAGTLATPYGLGPYRVLLSHAASAADLSRYILEWRPIALRHPLEWLFWLKLAVVAGACAAAARARRADFRWETAAVALALGAAAQRHGRLISYFDEGFVVFAAAWCAGARARLARRTRAAATAWLALAAAFLFWFCRQLAWTAPVDGALVVPSAARFLDENRPVFEGLRTLNRWEWGGYLSWRLRPWYRVYMDGRYLFHSRLARLEQAEASPEGWQSLLDAERLDAVVFKSLDVWRLDVHPEDPKPGLPRPWYVDYFPSREWALVYWDEKSLIFVRRGRVPADWLSAHDYRWLLPKDGPTFSENLRLGKIPPARLQSEIDRHRRETQPPAPLWRATQRAPDAGVSSTALPQSRSER